MIKYVHIQYLHYHFFQQQQYAACVSYSTGNATYRCAADSDGGCEANEIQLPDDSM